MLSGPADFPDFREVSFLCFNNFRFERIVPYIYIYIVIVDADDRDDLSNFMMTEC